MFQWFDVDYMMLGYIVNLAFWYANVFFENFLPYPIVTHWSSSIPKDTAYIPSPMSARSSQQHKSESIFLDLNIDCFNS